MNTFRHYLLMLLITAIPIVGYAYNDNEQFSKDGNHYRVVSGTKNTLAYLGSDESVKGHLALPKTIFDGRDVTFTVIGVEYSPLFNCKNITSVTLPETIEYINNDSFRSAYLTSLNIPKSVIRIHDEAWASIPALPKFTVDAANQHFSSDTDGALYSKDKSVLRAVPSNVSPAGGVYTINESVQRISRAAFVATTGLTKLIFPKNLKQIIDGYPTIAPTHTIVEFDIVSGGSTPFNVRDGVLFRGDTLVLYPRAKPTKNYQVPAGVKGIVSYAISNSSKMETIDLNDVTYMGNAAIYAADNLTSITLPKNIRLNTNEAIKDGLVEGCFEANLKVKEYKVQPGNQDFMAEDDVIYSTDKKTLYFYPPSKPGETFNIPSSVTKIARRAFQGSKYITSMFFPDNVETINAEAFREAEGITKITFSSGSKITSISYHAFRACKKLKEVTLPKGITSLSEVFYLCPDLETINIPDGSKLQSIESKAFITNTKLKAFNFLGSCELKHIRSNAFLKLTELKTFNFPKTVNTIDANAFSGCSSMATVTFDPESEMLNIGSGAFADCGLTSFDVPSKVKTIEKEAFRNCNALTKVNVSETTTVISPEAFKYCTNLTDINVDKKNSVYSSVNGYLLSKDKETLVIFPTGKANSQFTLLPPSITAIGDYAFYDCQRLTNVTIPNKVTKIGKRAFGLCANLNTITFLCDEMINPSQINQVTNDMSFDDGSQAPTMFNKIHIYVRNNKLAEYNTNEFYKKFLSISPSFIDGTEEYIAVSDNAVNLLNTTRTDYTFVLPTTVANGGKNYTVSLIGDYAFQNTPASVKEVVVKSHVRYIGAKAFVTDITNNTSTVENVFFIESVPTKDMLSTTRFELDETEKNYNEFAQTTNIYVKKSAFTAYQTAWAKKVYDKVTGAEKVSPFDFTSKIDYRIKDVKITTKYGTFAREFDTYFGDYYASNNNTEVAAFVAGKKIIPGTGDYGSTTQHIRMTSIDLNGGASDSYAYVPAGTGVLLKVLDKTKDATPTDFYYTIGEKDNTVYNVTNNIMKGITVKPADVAATASSPVYVMQKGSFQKVTATIPANKFPIHRAYLKLENVPSGAKVMFHFDDDTTTGIEDITIDGENKGNDTFYNLNGQRVSNPQRGIYIHNGKKVIIK